MGHMFPNELVAGFEYRGASQWPTKVHGLGCVKQFDGLDMLQIPDNLVQFPAADRTHGDVVFLAEGGRDAVCTSREAEALILGSQCGSRVLRNHEAGI